MDRPLRIVIADDHALFRQGLRSQLMLQEGVSVAAEVDRVGDLEGVLERTPCDILLLDLQMERSSLGDIDRLARYATVVVVTASERPEDALVAIRSGAKAVVFKRFAIETLKRSPSPRASARSSATSRSACGTPRWPGSSRSAR